MTPKLFSSLTLLSLIIRLQFSRVSMLITFSSTLNCRCNCKSILQHARARAICNCNFQATGKRALSREKLLNQMLQCEKRKATGLNKQSTSAQTVLLFRASLSSCANPFPSLPSATFHFHPTGSPSVTRRMSLPIRERRQPRSSFERDSTEVKGHTHGDHTAITQNGTVSIGRIWAPPSRSEPTTSSVPRLLTDTAAPPSS